MKASWIQTYTGRQFWPLAPRLQDVALDDIAHALSLKCRFAGHCREFYSIAEHSVRVSRAMEARGENPLWGLMHDAGEAYLADVGRPIKAALHVHIAGRIETFEQAEDRLLAVIAAALGFPPIDYAAVREADTILLATEARDLMAPPPADWRLGVAPLREKIVPVSPAAAERMFLRRWDDLQRKGA